MDYRPLDILVHAFVKAKTLHCDLLATHTAPWLLRYFKLLG